MLTTPSRSNPHIVMEALLLLALLACNLPARFTTPGIATDRRVDADQAPSVTTTATSSPLPATPPGDPAIYGSIRIEGTPAFVNQTRLALALLESKAPDAYTKVQTYIAIIDHGEHSGMWAFEAAPRLEVGDRSAFYSVTWYASIIVHDATHSELYHKYLAEHPNQPVPQDVWTGVPVEQFCNAVQLDVLIRIGGPQNEVEYLAAQSGDHCDVDGDGDCDWDDYYLRDW